MGDDLFVPEDNLTRAQFIKMLACLTPGVDAAQVAFSGFEDIAADDWYASYVNWGSANDIIFGYGDSSFGPNDPITREQMCCMIERYCTYLGYDLGVINGSKSFNDQSKISSWAEKAVEELRMSGLITGDNNNIFAPQDLSTRSQAATITCKFLMGILDAMENPSEIACN